MSKLQCLFGKIQGRNVSSETQNPKTKTSFIQIQSCEKRRKNLIIYSVYNNTYFYEDLLRKMARNIMLGYDCLYKLMSQEIVKMYWATGISAKNSKVCIYLEMLLHQRSYVHRNLRFCWSFISIYTRLYLRWWKKQHLRLDSHMWNFFISLMF